ESPRAVFCASSSSSSDSCRDPEFGAARAWVAAHLFLTGLDGLAPQGLERSPFLAERALRLAVLERMEAQYPDCSPYLNGKYNIRDQRIELSKLGVHDDPKCLECSGGSVNAAPPSRGWHGFDDQLRKLIGGHRKPALPSCLD